jgi:acetylornithine/succinyldiaminopimelate/putrescine aminotransferase
MLIVASLKDRGVLMFDTGPDSFRAVTHLHVAAADVDKAISQFAKAFN